MISTLDDERREVWASILEAERRPLPDEDRTAACRYLLRHIVTSTAPRIPGFRYDGLQSAPSPAVEAEGDTWYSLPSPIPRHLAFPPSVR